MSQKINRVTEVDFVKGVCILAVHLGHCCIDLGVITYLWQSFFMSAFFIFAGYWSKPTSFRRILKSTLLLYYLWTIGLHALMAVRDIRHGAFSISVWMSELKPILLGINQPDESSQLWFLVALFTTKLIWFAILRFISADRNRLYVTFFFAVTGIILNLNGIHEVPFRLVTAMIMLPLFAFGYMAKKYFGTAYTHFVHHIPSYLLLIIMWCLGTFLNYKIGGRTISVWSEKFNFFPLFYFNAISGTLVFLSLSRLIDCLKNNAIIRARNAICFYGRNSLTAFLSVNFEITIVNIIFAKFSPYAILPLTMRNIITFFAVILLQIPTAWILTNPKIARIALLK